MSLAIVIPTFNESQNIITLLNKLKDLSKSELLRLEIVIIDDNSPDNTAARVRQFIINGNSFVHLISRRSKMGIGSAYKEGFKYALRILNSDYVMQMDADLSHNPDYIKRIIQKLYQGYSVVIGSRYITGGRLEKDWPFIRLANSKMCNWWTRKILGIRAIRDCTGGYRGIKSSTLRKLNLDAIFPQSYSFQVVLIYALVKTGEPIVEIPILFESRRLGTSKMRPRDTVELLWHVLKLRFINFNLMTERN